MNLLEQVLINTLVALILAMVVFALIGILIIYRGRKKPKLQKKDGNRSKGDAKRTQWKSMEQLKDRVFLLEEIIQEHGIEKNIDRVNRIISEVDYDMQYNALKKIDSTGTNKDFDKLVEQKEQQLREKLKKKQLNKTGDL